MYSFTIIVILCMSRILYNIIYINSGKTFAWAFSAHHGFNGFWLLDLLDSINGLKGKITYYISDSKVCTLFYLYYPTFVAWLYCNNYIVLAGSINNAIFKTFNDRSQIWRSQD